MIRVRKQTFQDVLDDKPVDKLQIVFTGTLKEANECYLHRPGFVWKDSMKHKYGGYYYNKEESIVLLLA